MARRGLSMRWVRWVACVAAGGGVFQVSGCDPAVRDTLLAGLQTTTSSLADTLISAFFISLDDESSGTTDGLTTT
ncbi:MAG: hypothetical protein IT449_16870 [Phycisphaerales bacterium]|nr:hypothetical protein [Phycisphaerales bacterium]